MNPFDLWVDFWVDWVDFMWGIHKRAWRAHRAAERRK